MNDKNNSRRFQYSLRAFLIVTTLATFAIYHWYTANRLRNAESAVRRLQDETGRLAIKDATLINLIAVDTSEANMWRWRLFIPKGKKYTWNVASEDIPFGKVPHQAGRTSVSNQRYWERDNEVLVTARLEELADGNYSLSVASRIGDSKDQMSGVTMDVPKEHLDWMVDSRSQQVDIAGKSSTQTFDPTMPIMLFSKRPMATSPNGEIDFDQGLTKGLAIWLEPK